MPSSSARRLAPEPPPPPRGLTLWVLRHLKRVIVTVIGATVLLMGVAMIVLPGPAFVVIPLGLGILALEFAWAERMLHRLKVESSRILGRQ
ncbi:MAG: PGPGW domain-containing protein [Deltaproteobacteria bacterium]|nr:PGPGW domain-containing protein [Deltaproteobacteria bacterium]